MISRIALLELLAAEQHEIWAHWMEYLFSVSVHNKGGSVTIPVDKVTRWAEQMKTHYVLLSRQEQKSDIEQAEKVLAVIEEAAIKHRMQEAE